MAEVYLNQIAHGRSGDKGDTSNVCIFARKPEYYEIIRREVTVEKVRAHFGDMVKGEITRYEVPTLNGFNFVMKHALGGGDLFAASGQPWQVDGFCLHADEDSSGGGRGGCLSSARWKI